MPLDLDPSLVQAAATENTALERLIAAVWPDAYRLAAGIVHDRGLAEDVAQEACAAMAVALASLKDARAFRTWFYRLVVHEAINVARRQPKLASIDESAFKPIEEDRAQSLDLANALRRLPREQRAVVLLHYYAGLNSREIAEAAHLPASTVRFHLMLARRALRRAISLAEHPVSTEAFSNAN